MGPSEPAVRTSRLAAFRFQFFWVCSVSGELGLLQVAFLRYLTSQTEEDRWGLAAVTGLRVGGELLNRITGRDKVEAYKVLQNSIQPCVCDLYPDWTGPSGVNRAGFGGARCVLSVFLSYS